MRAQINKYFLIGLLAIGLLDACKVSKDTPTPQPELPTTFRNAPQTTDTASIASLPWENFFTDATLKGLIDNAIRKNYDMQIALLNIEAAKLQLRQAKLLNIPTATLNVTGGTTRPSDNSLNGISLNNFLGTQHLEDYNANIQFAWEADIWGKIRNQKRTAVAAYLQTEESRKLLQTDIVSTVSKAFYNLLTLDEQMEVAQRNLRLNDSTLRIIRLQYDAGQVTLVAVQQAEAQQLTASQLIPQLEQSMAVQENALRILSGELPAAIERHTKLNEYPLTDKLSSGIPSDMLGRRPDVRSSELALTMANAKVGVTKARMYPSLVITASGGINAVKFSEWFQIPSSLFGLATAGIAQPLFQHKELKTQFEVAKVEREQSVIRFRQNVLEAVGEVSDALVKIEKLKSQYDIASVKVQKLQQAVSNASQLFENGRATYLEVIVAQSNVLQSELEVSTLKRDQLFAVVDLYRSLGGGWR
ncbi:TolC family protein [Chitinophaga sp. S165]|uniref:TolC family protein n=1 Tax=Chitinophaga sp. S165 TaxID=2135462 RepID=UPI000D70B01F|nr:TolC family protein [Chitinophaga sp. S165]PWV55655.1 NodT family efflux transporter outer membrane factor (OMF) lipoprotein [Chitinophaga sp. S165]